jgi:hypothetical protein
MRGQDDRDFQQWAREWQESTPGDSSTEEQIRHYVKRRGGLLWSWAVAEFVIGGLTLPLLAYFGWMARSRVELFAMVGLALITVAAVGLGWWNWRGILRSSAASTTEYLAISAERLRRMRIAWRIGWAVLAAQVVVFTIWIWDHLYSGALPHDAADERFAWGWLAGFSLAAVVGLVWFGRWITRDAARFEALRRELDRA